jgi:CDP-diacylglycerol--glycerol-3-phosphate 3-phosphatidyltransferase
LLSGLRIALVPFLLWLTWTGHPTAFLVTFAFSLSTDLLDGYLARRWRTGSELGARLDSGGDLATYAVFPLCAWWLFRERVGEQLVFVIAALIAFVAPVGLSPSAGSCHKAEGPMRSSAAERWVAVRRAVGRPRCA